MITTQEGARIIFLISLMFWAGLSVAAGAIKAEPTKAPRMGAFDMGPKEKLDVWSQKHAGIYGWTKYGHPQHWDSLPWEGDLIGKPDKERYPNGYPPPSEPLPQMRTTIVSPCTIPEIVTTLPLTMQGIIESNESPYGTLIVFGMKGDLEDSLDDIFPYGLNKKVDRARDYLRRWILDHHAWTPDFESGRLVGKSIAIDNKIILDRDGLGDSMRPFDYLKSFDMDVYLEKEREKHQAELAEWDLTHPKGSKGRPSEDASIKFGRNLMKAVEDMESLHKMSSLINNFQVIVQMDTNPLDSFNRFRGTLEAFGGPERGGHNDIIQFIDCDDIMTPTRVQIVEKVFQENQDVDLFYAGRLRFEMAVHAKPHMNNTKDVVDNWSKDVGEGFMRDITFKTPKHVDSPEWREEHIYSKSFDFREPDLKDYYLSRQKNRTFLLNEYGVETMDPFESDSLYTYRGNDTPHPIYKKTEADMWQQGTLKWPDYICPYGNHMVWTIDGRMNTRLTDQRGPFVSHNGAPAYRQDWIVNGSRYLPRTAHGGDVRSALTAILSGARVLGSRLPLVHYTFPPGATKRRLINAAKMDQNDELREDPEIPLP